jgi:hypothetical protein
VFGIFEQRLAAAGVSEFAMKGLQHFTIHVSKSLI